MYRGVAVKGGAPHLINPLKIRQNRIYLKVCASEGLYVGQFQPVPQVAVM